MPATLIVTAACKPLRVHCAKRTSNDPNFVQRLAKKREELEGRRQKQLWQIARAIDDVAREELKVLQNGHKPKDGHIHVEFVSDLETMDDDAASDVSTST